MDVFFPSSPRPLCVCVWFLSGLCLDVSNNRNESYPINFSSLLLPSFLPSLLPYMPLFDNLLSL